MLTLPNDLPTLIAAIDAQHLIMPDALSSQDLKTSLSLHLDQAFDFGSLFPARIQDNEIREELEQALRSDTAKAHVNRFFKRAPDTPVSDADCKLFYITIAEVLVSNTPEISRQTMHSVPYSICNLAQTLWARRLCLLRRDAFIVAGLLRLRTLPDQPPQHRPVAPPVQLDDYLDLPTLLQHLLAPRPESRLTTALFSTLRTEFYAQGRRYRPPTRREQQAGITAGPHGKVLLPGEALNAPAAQVLDALLHSQAFDASAKRLGETLQWSPTLPPQAKHLALAEQALIDTLYPPQRRRPGFILDFELFSTENLLTPPADIRLDLVNSVQASLACTPANAELASELLLRRFAPELLIEDYPADYCYQADLEWTLLRQGAWILLAQRHPLTFKAALDARAKLPAADEATAMEALRDTLALWAQLQKLIDCPAPWSAEQWQAINDRYLAQLDLYSVRELPDRIEQARLQLGRAGLDPDAHNADKHTHLQAYLDHGAYYAGRDLPDVSAWYESQFDAWLNKATAVYEGVLQSCVRTLDSDLQDRLLDTAWSCHAVAWPRYCGPVQGAVPGFGDSPRSDWNFETGTKGLVILLPGEQSDTLLEVFPEQFEWRTRAIDQRFRHRLDDGVHPQYQDYNDTSQPWDVASFPSLLYPLQAPAENRLQALAAFYAKVVALGNREALRAAGKGATRHELFLIQQRKDSLGRYLWKLFKNVVPLVGCFDVRSGNEAISCGLDAVFALGSAIKVGGRLIRPVARQQQTGKASRNAIIEVARRWSITTPEPLLDRGPGPRRWHSAPELSPEHMWFDDLTPHERVLPGQTPGAVGVLTAPDDVTRLTWGQLPDTVQINRGQHAVDGIINGTPYRYDPQQQGVAQRLHHAQLLRDPPPVVVPPPFPSLAGQQIALRFSIAPVDSGTPLFGQQVCQAFHTVRIEPFAMHVRSLDNRTYRWSQLMVRDGKVLHRNAGQAPRQVPPDEAAIRYRIIMPPVYHRRISVEPSAEFWFALPEELSPAQVELIARFCPPVRLGGLARTIADRRTLRAAVIEWRDEQWLMVEADSGIFYGARYDPWEWQRTQLHGLAAGNRPPAVAAAPRTERRLLDRIKDDDAINRYLETSETYRIVATRPNLQRDIDNLTHLLRDWIRHNTVLRPVRQSPYLEILEKAQEQLLPEYAKNILTQTQPQRALTGLTGLNRAGVIGLNKEIIPDWLHLADLQADQGQHVVGVLNRLLPASGSKTSYAQSTLAELLTEPGSMALKNHLGGANLSFAMVRLRDGSRRVYFSLSGGKKHQLVIPVPSENQLPPIRFVDARAYMQPRQPDPRFTQLPVLRSSDRLAESRHLRTLDSERLIASTLNADLLTRSADVQGIDVFTLFDTCRSCGGYVLPRLRLDYPNADFSVSWLLPYSD